MFFCMRQTPPRGRSSFVCVRGREGWRKGGSRTKEREKRRCSNSSVCFDATRFDLEETSLPVVLSCIYIYIRTLMNPTLMNPLPVLPFPSPPTHSPSFQVSPRAGALVTYCMLALTGEIACLQAQIPFWWVRSNLLGFLARIEQWWVRFPRGGNRRVHHVLVDSMLRHHMHVFFACSGWRKYRFAKVRNGSLATC